MNKITILSKKLTRTTLGSKNFQAVQNTLRGLEIVQMIKKWQMRKPLHHGQSAVEQIYVLATLFTTNPLSSLKTI